MRPMSPSLTQYNSKIEFKLPQLELSKFDCDINLLLGILGQLKAVDDFLKNLHHRCLKVSLLRLAVTPVPLS